MKLALVGPELEENLAMRFIDAAVVANGYESRIFDFHQSSQIPQLAAQITECGPDVVGLSMVFTARAREYVQLIRALRTAGYRGHITAGGHFASFHASQLLESVPELDSVLHGEGERAAVELLEKLVRPSEVAGISCRCADGGIVETPPRQPLDNLDELPFPTRPTIFHRYFDLPIANVLSGRGCFGHCAFCSINAWHRKIGGRRFRQRSEENLATEMARLYHERGVRIFNFHDDNFFLPRHEDNFRRFSNIRDALRRRGVGRIGIQIKARPDTIEERCMSVLAEIGLFRVFLGVESNSVVGLKALGRGINREQNHRALRLLKDMGLHVTFNLLMFEPDCTIADLRDNIEFIAEQADVPLNFCRTEVYSGTPLEQRLRKVNRLEGDWFGYGYTIADPAAQLAYEIFRTVFTPRNFDFDGMNLRGMTLDYYFHILRHFHPAVAEEGLRRHVKSSLRELNASNVELLNRICDFASTANPGDTLLIDRFAHSLIQQRQCADKALSARVDAMLAQMRGMAAGATGKRGAFSRATAAAAAAAIAISVVGCRDTHPTEMAPPPNTRPVDDIPDTHQAEMAPKHLMVPPRVFEVAPPPPSRPKANNEVSVTTRPATRPAVDRPPLNAADARRVQETLLAPEHAMPLSALARKHEMIGQTVLVDLELDRRGMVARYTIRMGPKDRPAFQKELATIIGGWQFPAIRRPGTCTVEVKFGQFQVDVAPFEMVAPPDHHMHERAPGPIR